MTTQLDLEWLIIGGGIHGVHIATRLLQDANVNRDALRIVDPGQKLLERWCTCTQTTGMQYLRSPVVHHLASNPWSLRNFAKNYQKTHSEKPFAPPYDRPSLAMFNEHCTQLIEQLELDQLHIKALATQFTITDNHVTITLSNHLTIHAKHIVLAIGASNQPEWPTWAPRNHPRVHHVFAHDMHQHWPTSPERIAVVGGGISAVQIALRLLSEGHSPCLISRHPVRKHQFDSDPGWVGPKLMAGFLRESNMNQRRAMISHARHPGSLPPGLAKQLEKAIKFKQIHWHEDDIATLQQQENTLTLLSPAHICTVDRILLATGFSSQRPGGKVIDDLISSSSLPCAKCGYPIVDQLLRWHPRIHVSGPLAELELGPSARNITGARRTGDRLVGMIKQRARHKSNLS